MHASMARSMELKGRLSYIKNTESQSMDGYLREIKVEMEMDRVRGGWIVTRIHHPHKCSPESIHPSPAGETDGSGDYRVTGEKNPVAQQHKTHNNLHKKISYIYIKTGDGSGGNRVMDEKLSPESVTR